MSKVKRKPLKFVEAIAALRRRLGINPDVLDALARGFEIAAEEIASTTTDAIFNDMIEAVADVFEDGGTLADFRKRYDEITQKHGWTSPKGAAWHAELVFRLNTARARAAGRWTQSQRVIAANPHIRYYFRYVTAGDERVRQTHRLWHGVILPVEHDFWKTHWPPNGFNCRCHVQLVSERDLARYGWTVTPDNDPLLQVPPDDGWTGNDGIADQALAAAN